MSVANKLHVPWDVRLELDDDDFNAFVEVIHAPDAETARSKACELYPGHSVLAVQRRDAYRPRAPHG